MTLCNLMDYIACQASLSMEFFRQEYWSGLPFSSPGNLPDPGIENASPVSLTLQADSLPAEPSSKLGGNLKALGLELCKRWQVQLEDGT